MPHSAKTSASSRRGIYAVTACLYVALLSVWAWRLTQPTSVPIDPLRNDRLTRIVQYLSKAPKNMMQPTLMSLAFMPDDHLAQIDQWMKESDLGKLRRLTIQKSEVPDKLMRSTLLMALIEQTPTLPVVEAHLMIAASGDRLDDIVKLYAMERLARRARSEDQPEVSALILERACAYSCAGWPTVLKLVEACNLANRPSVALRAVTTWIQQKGDETNPQMEEARDLQISLMIAGNRTDEALNLQLDILRRLPTDATLPDRILERATVCAMAAKDYKKLLPLLQRNLAFFPEHQLSWDELAHQTQVSPSYVRWLKVLASLIDDEGSAENAADLYLRLAACGNDDALHRLCDLATVTSRNQECESILRLLLGQPARQQVVMEAAVSNSLAKRLLQEALRNSPQDLELHYAATRAQAAQLPPAQAAAAWTEFLSHFPNDLSARRELIACHLRSGQKAFALRQLALIPKEDRDDSDQARLTSLSESLGTKAISPAVVLTAATP